MARAKTKAQKLPDAFDARRLSKSTNALRNAERLADAASLVEQLPLDPNDIGDEWLALAECSSVDPDQFHPASDPATPSALDILAGALTVCDVCPVHAACRNRRYDLGAVGSVWGGVYYPTGARGQRPCATTGCTKPVANVRATYCGFEHEHAVKVGTDLGYNLHIRAKVLPCVACSEGHYQAHQKYNQTTGPNRAGTQRGPRAATPGRRVASA